MTVEELREVAEKETARQAEYRHRITCCSAAGCASCGGTAVHDALAKAIKARNLEKEVELAGTGCMGLCGEGPLVRIAGDGTLYQRVDAAVAERIIEEHIAQGKKVEENLVDTSDPFFHLR